MRVTVEYYGLLRPLMGASAQPLDFAGRTVADALECLCAQAPQLRDHLPRVACALDDELVTPDHPLVEHQVLALIPPVSGGSRLHQGALDLDALLAETADPASGALVVFAGTVRNENEGRAVEGISYSAHVALAEKGLQQVESETCARFPIRQCRIVHRVGELVTGEISVLVVVRAAHRADAFAAAQFAIDTLKRSVPVWKEERYTGGESAFLDGVPLETRRP